MTVADITPTMTNIGNLSPRLLCPVVLIGLMGAGKSSVGRLLAPDFGVRFIDADQEIEDAANCSIAVFFTRYGEETFRSTEEATIARLLTGPPSVIAAGGGAFMSPRTRTAIRKDGLSVWIRADLDTLYDRVSQRTGRPLLETANPRATLADLMEQRYPVYSEADVTVDSVPGSLGATVQRIREAVLDRFVAQKRATP